jgi:hypothetical protein
MLKIIRIMLNADYTEHTHLLFRQLHFLKLNHIYHLEVAKFMYNYVNNNLPQPLQNMFASTHYIHSHSTRQHTHLRSNKFRLNTVFHSLLYKGPHIWNAVQTDIQLKNSIQSFTYSYKKYILKDYVDTK